MSVCRLCLAAAALVAAGCNRSHESNAIRLIEHFDSATVQGSPKGEPLTATALWDFSKPPQDGEDQMLGWKAGDGVSDLKVVSGKLTGKSTTDFPIIYVSRPKAVDTKDAFDSIDVRIRVSGGRNISASGGAAKPDFAQMIAAARAFPWPFENPLPPGERLQTLTLQAQQARRMNWDTLELRPTDVANATFEIESIHAVSQRERRGAIRSGVGWQGLADIYQETLVSRSPEKFTLDVEIPGNAWLDMNIGTLEDHPVTFKVAKVIGDREETLLEQTLTTPHRWEPAPVDLAAHSGKTKLRFWLDVPDERSIGFWGAPVIRVHGARPQTQRTAAAALGTVEPAQGVILILCDTLRKDHLPMYGYKRPTTPNLEKMAARGAVFLDNISPATWTKVATPSIMTSLYPTSHQVHDIPHRLSAAADTLAESYRSAGYATVAYSSVLFTGKFTNLQQGFEELHESASVDDPKYTAKTARTYIDRAAGWLERHRDTPFFMFLHVFDPHDPFEPRPPYDSLWADVSKKEQHEKQLAEIRKGIQNPLLKMFGMPTRAEIEKAGVNADEYVSHDKDWYDGSIRGMDSEVGRLIQKLYGLGLEGKVQIAFIADHGEEFLEHGRTFHGQSVYGELTNVPLMLYRQGVIPEGVQIRETVRSIDLMPTLLDLSGLPVPKNAQGQSLVPLLAAARDAKKKSGDSLAGAGGEADSESAGSVGEAAQKLGWKPEPAFSEKARSDSAASPPPADTESYCLVSGNWKLVHNIQRSANTPEFELYDHVKDPLNLKDIAAQNADVVKRLTEQLAGVRSAAGKTKLPKGDSVEGISKKDLDRLRSLGYVQ